MYVYILLISSRFRHLHIVGQIDYNAAERVKYLIENKRG